ncbi:jg20656 [Pararge aegeria aegeria]|uniref:Jg20656 protein n=1 Tax=Pararge aegeria aegeria TaxID=348720 RepID=A0A8S4RF81_9NEOP|nr:jg20656 [Pararge aegeria aegeria]
MRTYGSETRSLSMDLIRRLTQRTMERAMLELSLLGHIGNEESRRRTRVTVIAQLVPKLLQWAEHITLRTVGRWGPKVLEWQPRIGKRSIGWPPTKQTTSGELLGAAAGNRPRTMDCGTPSKIYIQQWSIN